MQTQTQNAMWTQPQQPFAQKFRHTFPSLLAFVLLLLWLFPLVVCSHLAFNEHMRFWFGQYMLIGLGVAFVPVVAYVLHVAWNKVSKPVVIVSFLLPALIFTFLSGAALIQAKGLVTELTVPEQDCTGVLRVGEEDVHSRTAKMDALWQSALEFHSHCLTRFAADVLPAQRGLEELLPSCPEYSEELDASPRRERVWRYLQSLEQHLGCTGFCAANQPALWTLQPVARQSCASALSAIVSAKMVQPAAQMLTYSLVTLCLVAVMIVMLGSPARKTVEQPTTTTSFLA